MNELIKSFFGLAIISAAVMCLGFILAGNAGVIIATLITVLFNTVCFSHVESLAIQTYSAVPIDEKISFKEIGFSRLPEVAKELKNICIKAEVKMPKFFIVKSSVAGSFCIGKDQDTCSIIITLGLIELLTDEELKTIIAREVGHIKNNQLFWPSCIATLAAMIGFFIDLLRGRVWGKPKDGNPEGFSPVATFGIILLSPLMGILLQIGLSKHREFLADQFSVDLTNKPKDLISALSKIELSPAKWARESNSHTSQAFSTLFVCSPFVSGMGFINSVLSVHPKLKDRIKHIEHYYIYKR